VALKLFAAAVIIAAHLPAIGGHALAGRAAAVARNVWRPLFRVLCIKPLGGRLAAKKRLRSASRTRDDESDRLSRYGIAGGLDVGW
jgi:hypothetical protein